MIKKKIILILNFFWEFIENNKKVFFLILLTPPLFLVIFFNQVEKFIFIIFIIIINYYLFIILYLLIFYKLPSYRIRSPIKFIKNFNLTSNKDYLKNNIANNLVGVEVGVLNGDHALKILSFLNIEKLYLVDPWKSYYDYNTNLPADGMSQKEFDKMYHDVSKKFSENSKVEIIRDYSINASKKFEDQSLDFVYLDGDHSYESVKNDLESWYPKLKKFAVMCGDDYGHISGKGVIKAVTEFAFKNNILVSTDTDNQFWFVKT